MAEGIATAATVDVSDDMALLASLGMMITDGGGIAPAARRIVEGPAKVAAFLLGLTRKYPGYTATTMRVNGAPGLVLEGGDDYPGVLVLTVADGLITQLLVVRNPAKLGRIGDATRLTR